MAKELPSLSYYIGDTRPISLTFTENGVALAGPTAIVLNVYQDDGNDTAIDTGTGADQTGGVWSFTFGDSSVWPEGNHRYNVVATYADGTRTLGRGSFRALSR